ncbi:SRPBCC family protein [Paenarthrobacter sp. NPDC092416]|uniref:SRPBCC family protein n=1 Tax=Paenarthrobacter sp. NPDC092416 TaxID=3364386 RepID=UPI00380F1512
MTTKEDTVIEAPPGTPFMETRREFDAAPEGVFRAFTDPELVKQWLGPRRLTIRIEEFDARAGGTYRYFHTDVDGKEFGFRGVFHDVQEPRLLIQTFEFDGAPDQVSLDTTWFEDLGGRTRLVQRSVFLSVEARDMALATGMESGIVESMERLDELLR